MTARASTGNGENGNGEANGGGNGGASAVAHRADKTAALALQKSEIFAGLVESLSNRSHADHEALRGDLKEMAADQDAATRRLHKRLDEISAELASVARTQQGDWSRADHDQTRARFRLVVSCAGGVITVLLALVAWLIDKGNPLDAP